MLKCRRNKLAYYLGQWFTTQCYWCHNQEAMMVYVEYQPYNETVSAPGNVFKCWECGEYSVQCHCPSCIDEPNYLHKDYYSNG